jgi:ribosomal protein S6--L-glutamate ligase
MLAFTRNTTAPNEVLVDVFERLRRRGHEVELGVANELLLDAHPDALHDLYILKSHSALWLSLAGVLYGQGAKLLNPYLACVVAHDKIVAERRMEAAHVPTPRSWVTGDLQLLRRICEERPLVVKPYVGGHGLGVRMVRDPHDLAGIEPPPQPMLAQEFVPGDEIKVYVIGDAVFGVRKLPHGDAVVREPCPVGEDVRRLALRCGRVFGLSLFGLDVIEGAQGPVVIDVNYFPSYKGIPGAPAVLAHFIEEYAMTDHPSPILDQPYHSGLYTTPPPAATPARPRRRAPRRDAEA